MADEVAACLRGVSFAYGTGGTLSDNGDSNRNERIADHSEAVLRDVDVCINKDEITVVLGASGSGKSTLIKTLNALVPSFHHGKFCGDISVLGQDVATSQPSNMAQSVGMVLQDYESQLFGTSIDAEVAFGLENLAIPPKRMRERIGSAVNRVGLRNIDTDREPSTLSGGQKQRLALASVLAMHPKLLVLDETTSDIDPRGTTKLIDTVNALVGDERGPETIVMVTHGVPEALFADRVILLRNGQIHCTGSLRDVLTNVEALRTCQVAVPPLVAVFDRLGWSRNEFPLRPDEAVSAVRKRGLTWEPPARNGETLPGVPGGTGENIGDRIFKLEGVVHEYSADCGSIRAVDGVDLTIHKGEVVAIVGHNGSGKTTLAKHLNGLLSPDEGTVWFQGRDVSSLAISEMGRTVGYVFQNPDHQLFAASVREEVAFGAENLGITGNKLERRVDEAIEAVTLGSLEEADPFSLSRGQRQRVALASVLATDPDVIVFDEPTTGLDATHKRTLLNTVARRNRKEALTVVMVTHDMEMVATYAPRAVVLRNGTKVADTATRELFSDEERLSEWGLAVPQTVAFSNRLGKDGALPALSADEVVTGLGENK